MLSGPFTVQRSRADSSYLATTGMPGWGYGVVDPSSGTAIMMEVARVLGQRVKAGWRPRRSIVFAR